MWRAALPLAVVVAAAAVADGLIRRFRIPSAGGVLVPLSHSLGYVASFLSQPPMACMLRRSRNTLA